MCISWKFTFLLQFIELLIVLVSPSLTETQVLNNSILDKYDSNVYGKEFPLNRHSFSLWKSALLKNVKT